MPVHQDSIVFAMNQMNRNRIESAMKSFLACMMKLAKDTAALACALNSIKKVLCMLPHADVLMGCRMPGLLLNGIWLRGTSVRCIFAWPSVLVMMSTPSPRHEGCQTCKWQKAWTYICAASLYAVLLPSSYNDAWGPTAPSQRSQMLSFSFDRSSS